MELLVEALLTWLEASSGYKLEQIPRPQIVEMSARELTSEYYSGAPHLAPQTGVDPRLNALYSAVDGNNGTIFILEATSVDGANRFKSPYENPLFHEILLHELIHHAQWQSGAPDTWACQSYGEHEAYALGGLYLHQAGVRDPIPDRRYWASLYARC